MQARDPQPGPPPGGSAPPTPSAPGALPVRPTLLDRLRNRDHTRGALWKSLLVLSAPSLLMSLVGGAVVQLVELRFLGELGSDALASAGATNQIVRQLIFLAVMGTSAASQMLLARTIGAGALDRAEHVLGQTLVIGMGIGLFATLLGLLAAEPIAALVVADAQVPVAAQYLRVMLPTLSVMILIQLGSSALNAAGDTTTPMMIAFAQVPLAIGAQYVLTFGAGDWGGLGLPGIPLGGAAAGVVGVGVQLWALSSGRCRIRLHALNLRPEPARLVAILRMAWQPALHMVARSLMVGYVMWMTAHVFGGATQAAFTIGLTLEMPSFMIAFAVANACATMVGQNLGAGDLARTWRAIGTAMAAQLGMLWPLAAAIFAFRHSLVTVFTDDPTVASLAADYLFWGAMVMSFYGLYFVAFRTLQAAGDMDAPMWISLGCAALIGAPLAWGLSTQTDLGTDGLWIGMLAYSASNCVITLAYLATGRFIERGRSRLARSG